jgi:hypothetical protein
MKGFGACLGTRLRRPKRNRRRNDDGEDFMATETVAIRDDSPRLGVVEVVSGFAGGTSALSKGVSWTDEVQLQAEDDMITTVNFLIVDRSYIAGPLTDDVRQTRINVRAGTPETFASTIAIRAEDLSHSESAGIITSSLIRLMAECKAGAWPFSTTSTGWGGTSDHGRDRQWGPESDDGVGTPGYS